MTNQTITSPKGFLAAGLYCGVKQSGKPDLALVVCPTGARAAAVFTTNAIQSAAVVVCKQHIATNPVYAAVRSEERRVGKDCRNPWSAYD